MRPYLLREAQEKLNIARCNNRRMMAQNDRQLQGHALRLAATMVIAAACYAAQLHIAIVAIVWVAQIIIISGTARLLVRAWRMHLLGRKIEKLQTEINNQK